jgi:hypothetical protein
VTTGHKTGKAQGLYSNNIRKNNLGRKRKGRKEERRKKERITIFMINGLLWAFFLSLRRWFKGS